MKSMGDNNKHSMWGFLIFFSTHLMKSIYGDDDMTIKL